MGINLSQLLSITDHFGGINKAKAKELGYEVLPGETWIEQDVDILIPAAMENQITGDVLNSPPRSGLSSYEATLRLREEGANELPSSKPRSVCRHRMGCSEGTIFLLLLACGTIHLFLGNRQEAVMLPGFVFLVSGISFYQDTQDRTDARSFARSLQPAGLGHP